MASTLKLPVGIENFEEIRKLGFYYIDKTRLIEQLLQGWGKVTLFTRPRRFGKTLNMSMLKSFFEMGTDKSLFDDLYISGNKELCDEHMGKYPVIFLSLKGVEGLELSSAKRMLCVVIEREINRHYYLKTSDVLTDEDRTLFTKMLHGQDDNIEDSIRMLSQLLYKHYGQKAVILIDEYDVPLDKAFQNGYYKDMVSLIRGLFGQALKTNEFLQFAVLTGCLRVSKESIFTGLNNFEINSIVDIDHDEQFGFTDDEVMKLLLDYDRSERYSDAKEWYDGYHFGNADIYCPWDVINFAKKLVSDPSARPSAFWINSSGNDMVKRFVDKADQTTRDEIEKLVAGGFVEKQLRLDLTYDEIDNTIDNLWSVLFTTGYLTKIGEVKVPDAMKENFYHGLLLGLLRGSNPDWLIKSNRESGDGFSDILIEPEDPDAGIVIEVKYAKEMKELDAACEAAMAQIKDKRYDETLRDEGRCDILAYGIAFCRKRCRVVGEKF